MSWISKYRQAFHSGHGWIEWCYGVFVPCVTTICFSICIPMFIAAHCMAQSNANSTSAPRNGLPTSIVLTDITRESGVDFLHNNGASGQGYLVEGVLGGIALFDYDSDGLIDIFLTNGAPLRGSALAPNSLR
ncbi:MAG: hypothetical protein ABL921_20470, partial [Pirellula sp.]